MGTYTEILYQVVFGSKNHVSFLNSSNEERLYKYIAATCRKKGCKPYKIGGYSNHIHLIISLIPKLSLSDFVKEIKNASSWMMKENRDEYSNFKGWMSGYSAFTYSKAARKNLVRYVENQSNHHRKKSYPDELIAFYEKFGIEYNL